MVEASSERLWVGTNRVCCFCRAYSVNNGQPRLGHCSWKLAFSSYFPSNSIVHHPQTTKPKREALGSTILINITGASAIGLLAPAGSHTGLLLGVSKHRRGRLAGSFWKGDHKVGDGVEGYHVPGTPPAMMELGLQSNSRGRGSPTADR